MSCAKIDPALHQAQKPPWIKVRLPSNPVFFSTKALISDLQLHTVCESAQCPNRWECWSQGTATFMIAGDRCTRACGFCAVTTAKPFALEDDEPKRVAEAVRRMNLKHVVITAVARDDLKDGGADHFARTITAIREMDPSIVIEVLVPDFHAHDWSIQTVLNAGPDIFNHNMETVERLTPVVRSRAKYRTIFASVAARQGTVDRDCDKERSNARPWRKGDRTFSDHGRFARSWLRSFNNGPVLAAEFKAFAGRRIHHTRAIQLLWRHRARERLSLRRFGTTGA